MPLSTEDQELIDRKKQECGTDASGTRLLVLNAADAQKLGPLTVVCTILNRTIGSGIFVTPAIILRATDSVGASLLIWAAGALISIFALLVWLELGLSIPKFELPWRSNETEDGREAGTRLQPVPRSGGEKNYLEYIYNSPQFCTTCMYGVLFITLGNLAGNAVAFGTYVLKAADMDESRHQHTARGLAVVCMTAACLLHGLWRKGGILLNNLLALLKVLVLLAIIGIGFRALTGASVGGRHIHGQTIDSAANTTSSNFERSTSFRFGRNDFASYANSILFAVYTYSGYEQPFYVLSEVYRPKKYFAKSTVGAMSLVVILFMLVNIAYLSVVSYNPGLISGECLPDEMAFLGSTCEADMATVFFGTAFGPEIAPRVMSGILAVSIFGNIVVMTFTASRVKQEIAKEGVLPFSLFWARSITTPWEYLKRHLTRSPKSATTDYQPEQSPVPALFLHWIFSMILIAFTSFRAPEIAYRVLVTLYSYTIVLLVGFFVSTGLLYLRFFREKNSWSANAGFHPWGGPTAAIGYAIISGFLLVAPFIPPKPDSPFVDEIAWYIVPTVGLGALVLGFVYYLGLVKLVPRWFMMNKMLVADREAVIVSEHGEYVQYMELVDAAWETRDESDSEFEMKAGTRVSVLA